MVGQTKLVEKVNNLTLDNMPHTLMLLGERGCGKRTLMLEICHKLGFYDSLDITDMINLDTVIGIQTNPNVAIYCIDCDKISVKEQNTILKLLEEPVSTAYIILLCTNKSFLLETVINRCIIWEFESYTKDQLLEVALDQNLPFEVFSTPGKCKEANFIDVDGMINLCRSIFNSINRACYANVLVLPNKLYYKEAEENKYPADLFFELLNYICAKEYMQHYALTRELLNSSKIPNIDKCKLFENFLFKLKMSYGN